jgi:hypothetical protein
MREKVSGGSVEKEQEETGAPKMLQGKKGGSISVAPTDEKTREAKRTC